MSCLVDVVGESLDWDGDTPLVGVEGEDCPKIYVTQIILYCKESPKT